MFKRLLKAFIRFFDLRDKSCPICIATKQEHSVEHVPNGFLWDGSIVNPFTFVVDDDGNTWIVNYNSFCRNCGHVWYVAGRDEVSKGWDEARQEPKLVDVKGERERISRYIYEHGSIPMHEYSRIAREERIKAGFCFDSETRRWCRIKTPSS